MAGRRKARVEDASAWVFNRMADVYGARPAYPSALVDSLVSLAGGAGAEVLDVGAGIGHLALPLARCGLRVCAIEPAKAMLCELRAAADAQGLSLRTELATAEALPVSSLSVDLVLIADALHFLDAALTGREISRVLAPGGALAIVQCELAATPFMNALLAIMEESAPRRPRSVTKATTQVAALAGVELSAASFIDHVAVDQATLERILRSISFIGPAMNAQRFGVFRERVLALSAEPVWSRVFTLRSGKRG